MRFEPSDTDKREAVAGKMKAKGLPDLLVRNFLNHYDALLAGGEGFLDSSMMDPVEALPFAGDIAEAPEGVQEVVARSVVIKLNGGLGTSMGLNKAKSLLEVRDGCSFLDRIVRQIIHQRNVHDCAIPLVFMNSFYTEEDTLEALAKYPDLKEGQKDIPFSFVQHRVPKLCVDTLMPVSWPQEADREWCPPGHGDFYPALVASGLLKQLLDQGFRYAFVSNADNLGAVMDPSILAYWAKHQTAFMMEVALRTPADRKGGHLARGKGGGLLLRERAQCPPDEMDRFQDIEVYRYFNTNNLWIDLQALDQKMREGGQVLNLSLIMNEKHVDATDETSPRVYQLETAMGSALSVFPDAEALHVPRSRFIPVKTVDDFLALRSDLYPCNEAGDVVLHPSRNGEGISIHLDPRYYRTIRDFEARFPEGYPSLKDCFRLSVVGDVRFEGNVTCRGVVEVVNPSDQTMVIPEGTVLGDLV